MYKILQDETPAVEKLNAFKNCVLRNWNRIFVWREKIEQERRKKEVQVQWSRI